MYRGEKKGWSILLSRTQAKPDRTVKEEQEEISRNHVPTIILFPVDIDMILNAPDRYKHNCLRQIRKPKLKGRGLQPLQILDMARRDVVPS